jgi:hypothetical protein
VAKKTKREKMVEDRLDRWGRDEYAAWHDLCNALVAAGAVTEADLKRSWRDMSTPGCRLLETVRAWGRATSDLAIAEHDY